MKEDQYKDSQYLVQDFTEIVVGVMNDIQDQKKELWPKLESLLSAMRGCNISQTRSLNSILMQIDNREEELLVVTRLQDQVALRAGSRLKSMVQETVQALVNARLFSSIKDPQVNPKFSNPELGKLSGNIMQPSVIEALNNNPWYLILFIGSLHK